MNSDIFSYVIVFNSTKETANISPLLFKSRHDIIDDNSSMHMLDEDLIDIIPAIKYVLHLPRFIYDVIDCPDKVMLMWNGTSHNIILIPDNQIKYIEYYYNRIKSCPTLFIVSDNCSTSIIDICNNYRAILGMCKVSELTETLLNDHWNSLALFAQKYIGINEVLSIKHCFLSDENLPALPLLFYANQLNEQDLLIKDLAKTNNKIEETCIKWACKYSMMLATWSYFINNNIDTSTITEEQYRTISERNIRFNNSVVASLHGQSKNLKKNHISNNDYSLVDSRIISTICIHKAIDKNGIYIELPIIQDDAFTLLDELESHCIDSQRYNNKYIWNTITKIGKLLGNKLNDYQINALKYAKDITFFSDFPIGLAILPGDEVPLLCYKSITYRPLTPLTRQLQFELLPKRSITLKKKFKIAFAQCIDNDDKIFDYSEYVYGFIQNRPDCFTINHATIKTVEEMIGFVNRNRDADILYISAHGWYKKDQNIAGIAIGSDIWMANENLVFPPVVILSACHVSPRGRGAVCISDLIMRNGAIAVLGTSIPVDVIRNDILMVRLFTYMVEIFEKRRESQDLSQLWNHIVFTNAIHEIMKQSKGLEKWMYEEIAPNKTRLHEFELERCVGRLRPNYVYSDTIAIIKEMLNDDGLHGNYDSILNNKDFFPESFFYQWIGSPDSIMIDNTESND